MKKKLISGMLAICLIGSIPVYPVTANAEPAIKHTHSFACHEEYNFVCTDDHEHSKTCYEASGDLVCGIDEGTEHIHNEDGYECRPVGRIVVCGKEEHIHDDECYTEEEKPFEKTKLPETGFFEEYDYSVSQEETDLHENETDITPATRKVLDCNTDEHIHTDECYMQVWECRKKTAEKSDDTEDSVIKDNPKAELPTIVPFEQGTLKSKTETNSAELPKIVSFEEDILEGQTETANDVISNSVSTETDEEADEATEESTPVEGEEEDAGGEDVGGEEIIDGIMIDKSYVYDNDMFHMIFYVSGYAYKGEYTGDISDIKEQDLDFQMKMIPEDSEEYQAYVDYLNENSDISNLPLFQAMDYSLNYKGIKLDIDSCDVIVNILPTQNLLDILNHSYSNMDFSMVVSKGDRARTIIDDGGEIGGEDPGGEESGGEIEGEDPGIEEGGDEEEGDVIEGPSEPGTEEPDGPSIADGTAGWEMCGDSIPICKNMEQHTREFDISGFLLGIHIEPMAKTSCNVQYYFDWERISYNKNDLREILNGHDNVLSVINTHNTLFNEPDLPYNGCGPTASPNGSNIRSLYVDNTTGKLKTETELTKLYETRQQEYVASSFLDFANIVKDNPNYILKEIWILKHGRDSNSVRREDWVIYENNENIYFSTCATCASIDNNCIFIEDESIVRFVYETTESTNNFATDFYDYDISDGKIYRHSSDALSQVNALPTSSQADDEFAYAHTEESGINNPLNYHREGAKFAFGNANTGTGLQHQNWDGNLINKNNQTQSRHPKVTGTYKGCTFGLATELVDGKIQYIDGVSVPNLFDDGSAIGKTNYDHGEFSLKFHRVGDTYTLNAVNGTNTSNLDTFNHPSPNENTTHYHIWTNNYWPMDSAGSYGTDGHDLKFGRRVTVPYVNDKGENCSGVTRSYAGKGYTIDKLIVSGIDDFPVADDGQDHNAYFGMHYKVQFDLNADYAGPLEYYFFGDDDMWVFLGDGDGNGKLVCDIGGVHSSVGEFVDLWDYIDKEAEKIHRHDESCYENGELTCGYVDHKQFTLNFYYTERGESGSTCFMQFTLPSVSSMDSSPTYNDYGHLMVEKKVSMADDDVTGNGEVFKFSANFKDEAEQALRNKFFYAKYEHTYRCYDVDGVLCCSHDGSTDKRVDDDFVIYNGGSFTLKNNQYIIVKYLPVGAQYKITEDDAGYTDNGDGGTKPTETAYKTDIYINDNLVGDKENLSAERSITGKIAKDETTEIVFENKIEKKVVESGVLPKTGGCGTYVFMIVGSLMIAVAGAWLVWRRRKR